MHRERIASQSEVIGAIVSEDSPCGGGPAPSVGGSDQRPGSAGTRSQKAFEGQDDLRTRKPARVGSQVEVSEGAWVSPQVSSSWFACDAPEELQLQVRIWVNGRPAVGPEGADLDRAARRGADRIAECAVPVLCRLLWGARNPA